MKSIRMMMMVAAAATALGSAPAAQAHQLGEPGYYGAVPTINGVPPRVWNIDPVVAAGVTVLGVATALYLNVPTMHRKDWSRYCSLYGACARPVHFVRDDWYRGEYIPAYRRHHLGIAPQRTHRPMAAPAPKHPNHVGVAPAPRPAAVKPVPRQAVAGKPMTRPTVAPEPRKPLPKVKAKPVSQGPVHRPAKPRKPARR